MLIKDTDITDSDYVIFLEWMSKELIRTFAITGHYLYNDEYEKKRSNNNQIYIIINIYK